MAWVVAVQQVLEAGITLEVRLIAFSHRIAGTWAVAAGDELNKLILAIECSLELK